MRTFGLHRWVKRLFSRKYAKLVGAGPHQLSSDSDSGFTLIELLVVVVILPLVIGALSLGLISVFSLQSGVSNRLSDSGDAQALSVNFGKDTQSATSITTDALATQCGTGTQLLGLVWGAAAGTPVVSYVEVLQTGGTWTLVRNYCTSSSALATPSSTSVIAYDVLTPGPCTLTSPPTCQLPPTAYAGSTPVTTSGGWTSVQGITRVHFPIYEPKSKYTYALDALPAAGASSAAANLGSPWAGPSCGFALPGTGAYASTLCFIGFSNALITSAEGSTRCASGATGVDTSVAVPGGYTMSFCLTVTLGNSNDSVVAAPFPTWGGAFLGNDINGTPFYSGVGCPYNTATTTVVNGVTQGTPSCINPAIYMNTSGATDTVTLSGIVVTDPEGSDASGYAVVVADAETTDPSESTTWTSSTPVGSPFVFSQVPNTSTSNEGDACNQTNQTNQSGQAVTNGAGLTGVGTNVVQCTSTWQSSSTYPRTGTVLLDVTPTTTNSITAPITISAQMHGSGLEGAAFGLLLP